MSDARPSSPCGERVAPSAARRDAASQTGRIRVGLVTGRSDFYGGGQRSLLELAISLRDVAVEPVVVLPGPGPLADALRDARIPWIPLALPALRPTTLARIPRALRRLMHEARDRRLDLLHSDDPRTALYAGLAALSTGRRHVWHLRASRPAPLLPDRLLLRLSHSICAVSRSAASRSTALRACRRVRVIPTGLPAIEFKTRGEARAALRLPRGPLIAGMIGRVERDKGVAEAIGALAMIRRACPGALLALLGPRDRLDPQFGGLRSDAASKEGLIVLGGSPAAAPLMRAFDLILHPSHHEALPRVLIEALFAGVPVVATDVGGSREIVEPGVNGLLVPPADAVALGESAAALARDPDWRRRLAEEGVRRASAHFTLRRMTQQIVTAYRSVLNAPSEGVTPLGEVAG
jgi:glycosyltransferase involved in cell wall biosynthesis